MSKTKFVIITSIDDDQEQLLSSLNETQLEKFVLELDQTDPKKRTSVSTVQDEDVSSPSPRGSTGKKRKADLTCVICGGKAIGYNFAQISCESCKGSSNSSPQETPSFSF